MLDNRPSDAPRETQAPEFRNQPEPTEAHASPDQARQGPRGWPVLIVLICGMVLAAIYIISLLIYADTSSPPPPQSSLPSIQREAATMPGAIDIAALHPPGYSG